MIRLAVAVLLAAALTASAAEKPRVTRAVLAGVEQAWDHAIRGFDVTEPYDILGTARGLYVPGFGVVLTSELNLLMGPVPTPFIPAPKGPDIEKLRKKKLVRLNFLKASMRQMLVAAAGQLAMVPANEQIVLGVTIDYRAWENREGLPNQIVMQAPRKALLDSKDTAIQTEEY